MSAEPVFYIGRARLGELLIQRGILTSAQLDEALEEQKSSGKFLGEILVAKGWASEEEVARALSEQLGLAYIDLVSHPAEPGVFELVPEDLCKAHQVVPLFTMGDSVTVAMANPLDTAAIEELEKVSHRHIRPVFATGSAIRKVLESKAQQGKMPTRGLETGGWPGASVIGLPLEPTREAAPAAGEPVTRLKAQASLAPVVQLVDGLISEAIADGASDIHLEPWEKEFRCRFRMDGVLYDRPAVPKEFQAAVISRIKILASMDIAEKRLPQDGRVQTVAAGKQVDLRVSTFPTMHGENVVIRILDKARALVPMEELGFSDKMFPIFLELISKPHGIILVTGPTGSGKTTTLYAALNRLNQAEKNIMTLEDPVEYELPGVCQSQVNVKAGLTFAMGLRSMVRQDPDIILIGEIRDRETADIAIHASLTGHLVFSTLHTNDAASAASRLVDMGVEPFLVATSLIGILAQRLVRVLCPSCKAPYQPPQEVLEGLGASEGKVVTLHRETGCARCRQTGYQGRIGIFELLVPNDRIRDLIAQRVPAGAIKEEAIRNGMVTLRQDGVEKVMRGATSLAELLRITTEE